MQRLLLKTLLYLFLFNLFFIAAPKSGICADTSQTLTLQKTRELIELGKYKEAESTIIVQLDKKPRDAQWRYLEALLSAEKGLSFKDGVLISKSISLFERLSEEFPELPEPRNNLGVLYDKTGQKQKAIKSFKVAILNNPHYLLAYENLADLYLFLAHETYLRGINETDKNNERLKAKSNYLDSTPFLSPTKLDLEVKKNKGF